MKKSDLRVGNWVLCKSKSVRVESIYDQGINLSIEDGYYNSYTENYDGYFENEWFLGALIEPIPLTPEILEKCGFERNNGRFWPDQYSIKINDFLLFADGFMYNDDPGYGINPPYDIKYLHQLQNLFWCLTGEELQINL